MNIINGLETHQLIIYLSTNIDFWITYKSLGNPKIFL